MPMAFMERFVGYFEKVASVLRGEADVATVFPNPTDVGGSRERVYASFLLQHLPAFCDVCYGGFLFNIAGAESSQIDIIVTSAFVPQYKFFGQGNGGKSFAYVDGSLAVVEVKSFLDKTQLESSLCSFASIPPHLGITPDRMSVQVNDADFANWPLKILFAFDGSRLETIFGHLNTFYADQSRVPLNRRPDIIHVLGKYYIWRPGSMPVTSREGHTIPPYTYAHSDKSVDVMSFVFVIHGIQLRAEASKFCVLRYHDLLNQIPIE